MKHFVSDPRALVTYYYEHCANGQLSNTHGLAACLISMLVERILQFGKEFECGYILPVDHDDDSWCDLDELRRQIEALPASGRTDLEMWWFRFRLNEVIDREVATAEAAAVGEEKILAQFGQRIGGYMLGYGRD